MAAATLAVATPITDAPIAVDAGSIAERTVTAQACPARLTHTLAHGAASPVIAQEPRGTGTLEVVVLAELTLVAAFTIAHALPTLALATPRARLVLTLPQAGLCVTQRAGGAVAVFATPALIAYTVSTHEVSMEVAVR